MVGWDRVAGAARPAPARRGGAASRRGRLRRDGGGRRRGGGGPARARASWWSSPVATSAACVRGVWAPPIPATARPSAVTRASSSTASGYSQEIRPRLAAGQGLLRRLPLRAHVAKRSSADARRGQGQVLFDQLLDRCARRAPESGAIPPPGATTSGPPSSSTPAMRAT